MNKTIENLKAAFSGESQARNKYTYFAKVAEKEGYNYIAKVFLETAKNEFQHAKEELKLLNGINDTKANLQEAIDGEHHETTEMYKEFAEIAQEEGNEEAAMLFRSIMQVEAEHESRFTRLLNLIKENKVYERDEETTWVCSKCGHVHKGKKAPTKCPCCKHPQNYFEPEDMFAHK